MFKTSCLVVVAAGAVGGALGVPLAPSYQQQQSCCIDYSLLSKPIGNSRLFFGECPLDKSPETVCNKVAELYGVHEGGMYPIPVEHSYGSNEHSPHYFNVLQSADVAVVGTGCCYNVFPNVMKGDKLLKLCENPIIGTDTLSILEFASVYVAGDFFPQLQPLADMTIFETELNAVVGGEWENSRELTLNMNINTLEVLGGTFSQNPLVIGGDVAPTTDAKILWNPQGSDAAAALGGSDFGQRVQDPIVRIRDPDRVKAQIATQVCALSKDLQELRVNGNVEIVPIELGNLGMTIACASGEVCIVDIAIPPLAARPGVVMEVSFSLAASISSLIINVQGRMVFFTANFINAPGVPVVWNFYEATDVDVTSGATWFGSVVVPRAGIVNVRAGDYLPEDGQVVTIEGSLVVGGVDSHTAAFFNTINHSFPQSLPRPESTVTMCGCLCPDQKYH